MPSKIQFVLDDIDKAMEESQERFSRSYVGASSIGKSCVRALQYSFRHCVEPNFEAKSLKRFEDGHHSEAVYIKRIKNAGYGLQHEEDGKQYGFSALGGWFRGHRDGMFHDLKGFGKAIWEHKSSAKWKKLGKLIDDDEATALIKWNSIYYDQAQLYMGYEGVDWHVTTVASEGSREEVICLTEFNKSDFKDIESKAETIIASDRLHPRISNNQTYWECKFCDAKDVCWDKKLPKPNCRNCDSIKFDISGNNRAICTRWSGYDSNGNNLSPSALEGGTSYLEQYRHCHMYMPDLVLSDGQSEPKPKAIDFIENDIQYFKKASLQYTINGVTFENGDTDGAISSMEMYENQAGRPWEGAANLVRDEFNGKFEGWKEK